jgi:hypothetical protein
MRRTVLDRPGCNYTSLLELLELLVQSLESLDVLIMMKRLQQHWYNASIKANLQLQYHVIGLPWCYHSFDCYTSLGSKGIEHEFDAQLVC